MVVVNDAPALPPVIPLARRMPLRAYLLVRSFGVMFTCMFGVAVFSFWVTFVAVSPITIVAPIVIPVAAVMRWYARLRKRGAEQLLRTEIDLRYLEPPRKGIVSRVWTIVRDPASWRTAIWALLHGVVACTTSALTVALFGSGVLYAIYPMLFEVTPEHVFNRPFGDLVHLHSVAQAAGVMPLALVCFGLWYGLAIPLARAELAVTRSLLDIGGASSR